MRRCNWLQVAFTCGVVMVHAGCGSTVPGPLPKAAAAESAAAEQPNEQAPTEATARADVAKVQTIPASAAEAIRAIDLRSLARLSTKRVLDDSATYLYYSAESSIAGAAGYYQSELESRGWAIVPGSTPDNPQYRDMLFSKNGFYVRLTVGASGDEGVVGIGLSNLGNANLLDLPRLDNAEPNPGSTPVNVAYETTQGIPEAVKFCREKLAESGWLPCGDMFADPPEAPHVKQLDYCRNAVRLMVSVIRDPRLLHSDKTMVSCLAREALPYDIPVIDGGKDLKLDTVSGRASYTTNTSVADLVEFYRGVAPRVSWRYPPRLRAVGDTPSSLGMHASGGLRAF